MKSSRYSYLINKSFINVLVASLLATMAMQLATSIEVIIAGNYISPDAVSVINLTMPMITFINAIYLLVGVGASFQISRQLGNNNYEGVKSTFSCSLVVTLALGLAFCLLLLAYYPTIAHLLTSDERLLGMQTDFLSVFAFQPIFFLLTIHFSFCIKSIGNTKLVPRVTLIGTAIQVATALVAVFFCGMDIRGIALSGCVGLATQALLFFWKGIRGSELLNKFTFRFDIIAELKENIKLALPMFVSVVMMGFVLLSINKVVASALGTDGLNIVSVCTQLMLLSIMLMTGINSAMIPIGNMMMGECDIDGVRMLNASVMKMVLTVFTMLFVVIQLFPSAVLNIFGQKGDGGIYAIRVYAFFLPLLAYSMLHMTCLMILSHTRLASLSAALRNILMLVFIALIAYCAPQYLWWGFPSSILFNEILIAIISYGIYRRTPNISPITLIPKALDSTMWSSSIAYNMQSLPATLSEAEGFLKESHVDDSTVFKLMLTVEELASNIVKFASKRKDNQRFDLLIRVMGDKTIITIKDDGIPFNPILKEKYHDNKIEYLNDILKESIGLKIVNNMGLHLEHKYMYGQNIVTIMK